jgi:hypothetical protein
MDEQWKEVPYHAIALQDCGFCGSAALMVQHTDEAGVVDFAVNCTMKDEHSPTGDDCPLYLPPDNFSRATKREAAQYWNEWATFGQARRIERQRVTA